jgi:hypothetical protein
MFARSTTILGKPQLLDEGIAYVRDTLVPAALRTDGCVGLSMLCDRDSGRTITTTAWADAAATRTSWDDLLGIRDHAAEILGGKAEVREWEVAVLHHRQRTPEGACARVMWGRCDPAAVESVVGVFHRTLVQQVDALPGFCSMIVLVDRETGSTVLAATYASRAEMKRAGDQAAATAALFTEQMTLETTEIAVFDVALNQLGIPDMV